MLILGRKEGESIIIGDNIEIMLLSIHEYQVRIGITAPREMPVHRLEIWKKIQQENLKPDQVKSNLARLSKIALEERVIDSETIGNR